MKILLTNDDGIKAAGLRALLACIPKDHKILVAAPATERSACSHSISLGQQLRVEKSTENGVRFLAVHGTPADSVKFALYDSEHFVPDLVISGFNHGANTGVSVFYSGTISAAREGFINGIPAIAISLCGGLEAEDFRACQNIAKSLIKGYQREKIASHIMLNVNVPPLLPEQIKGVRITRQAPSRFIEEFVPEEEKPGRKVYRLAGEIEIYDTDGTSDEKAVIDGFISITPLRIDLTDREAIKPLEKWLQAEEVSRG